METSKVKRIHDFGQSIWLDFIDRDIIKSGKLKDLIDNDGVRRLHVMRHAKMCIYL